MKQRLHASGICDCCDAPEYDWQEDDRFVVSEIKCFHSRCYGARCVVCKQWLTKHDHDEEEAAMCAAFELERTDGKQHVCPGPKS